MKEIDIIIQKLKQSLIKGNFLADFIGASVPKQHSAQFDRCNGLQQIDNPTYSIFKKSPDFYLDRVVEQFFVYLLQNRTLSEYLSTISECKNVKKYFVDFPDLTFDIATVQILEHSDETFVIDYRLRSEDQNFQFKPFLEKLSYNMSIRNESGIDFGVFLNEVFCCSLVDLVKLVEQFQGFLNSVNTVACSQEIQMFAPNPLSLAIDIADLLVLLKSCGYQGIGKKVANLFTQQIETNFGDVQIKILMMRYFIEYKELLAAFLAYLGGLFDHRTHVSIQKLGFKYVNESLFAVQFARTVKQSQYSFNNMTKYLPLFEQIKHDFDKEILTSQNLCQTYIKYISENSKNSCCYILFFDLIHQLFQSSFIYQVGFFKNGLWQFEMQNSELVTKINKIIQRQDKLSIQENELMVLLTLCKDQKLDELLKINYTTQDLGIEMVIKKNSPLLNKQFFDISVIQSIQQSFNGFKDIDNYFKSYYYQGKRIMMLIYFSLQIFFSKSKSICVALLQEHVRSIFQIYTGDHLIQLMKELQHQLGDCDSLFILLEPYFDEHQTSVQHQTAATSQNDNITYEIIRDEQSKTANVIEQVDLNNQSVSAIELQVQDEHNQEKETLEDNILTVVKNEPENIVLASEQIRTKYSQTAPQMENLLQKLNESKVAGEQFRLTINGEIALQKIRQFYDDHRQIINDNIISVQLKELQQMAAYRAFIFQKAFHVSGDEIEQYQLILNIVLTIRNLNFLILGENYDENSSLVSLLDNFKLKKCKFQ